MQSATKLLLDITRMENIGPRLAGQRDDLSGVASVVPHESVAVPGAGRRHTVTVLAGIGFTAPWLLLGLIALPILWWLLRAVPPAPLRRRFPAVSLLIGLEDRETTPDRTPWWLLLLRMLAIAAAIVGFAQPVLNPSDRISGQGLLPILAPRH